MTVDPILVRCEGSTHATHNVVGSSHLGMCRMCGELVVADEGVARPHNRQDILAMIDRGDFDEATESAASGGDGRPS